MTKPIVHAKQIDSLKRLTNSVNGNPRFLVTFTDGTQAQTMSDAAYCYEITNHYMRGPVGVVFTDSGRIRSMYPLAAV